MSLPAQVPQAVSQDPLHLVGVVLLHLRPRLPGQRYRGAHRRSELLELHQGLLAANRDAGIRPRILRLDRSVSLSLDGSVLTALTQKASWGTGFDYRGEETPTRWPSTNSHFGIVDLAGYMKDGEMDIHAFLILRVCLSPT